MIFESSSLVEFAQVSLYFPRKRAKEYFLLLAVPLLLLAAHRPQSKNLRRCRIHSMYDGYLLSCTTRSCSKAADSVQERLRCMLLPSCWFRSAGLLPDIIGRMGCHKSLPYNWNRIDQVIITIRHYSNHHSMTSKQMSHWLVSWATADIIRFVLYCTPNVRSRDLSRSIPFENNTVVDPPMERANADRWSLLHVQVHHFEKPSIEAGDERGIVLIC